MNWAVFRVNKVVHEETINCLRSLERLLLKEFNDEAVTDWSSRLFHKLTTLSEKKYNLRSSQHCLFSDFSECPLVWPLLSSSNKSSNCIADRPWTTLYRPTSIKSAWTRLSSSDHINSIYPIFYHMTRLTPWFCSFRLWRFINHLLTYLLTLIPISFE